MKILSFVLAFIGICFLVWIITLFVMWAKLIWDIKRETRKMEEDFKKRRKLDEKAKDV